MCGVATCSGGMGNVSRKKAINVPSPTGQSGSAPAKAGEVSRMQVPYGEDLAGHTGPESCGGGTREGDGEALTARGEPVEPGYVRAGH